MGRYIKTLEQLKPIAEKTKQLRQRKLSRKRKQEKKISNLPKQIRGFNKTDTFITLKKNKVIIFNSNNLFQFSDLFKIINKLFTNPKLLYVNIFFPKYIFSFGLTQLNYSQFIKSKDLKNFYDFLSEKIITSKKSDKSGETLDIFEDIQNNDLDINIKTFYKI